MIVLVMEIKARGFSRKWRSKTMEKLASGPVLERPDNYRARNLLLFEFKTEVSNVLQIT